MKYDIIQYLFIFADIKPIPDINIGTTLVSGAAEHVQYRMATL